LTFGTQARAEWRVLFSAALIGTGVGLGLGATYLAGGMAQAVTDHSRAERIAAAAAGGFSETVLQQEAVGMTPGGLRLARQHDPLADDAPLAPQLDDRVKSRAIAASGRLGSALDRSRELDCLTQAVYFEARGETPRGQAAVAQVVLNRVKHPAFPKTVCAVVFQGAASHGCQFSFACDGSMRRGREAGAWGRARKIAARALSGVVLADVGSATHFHTTGVSPVWGPRMLRVSQVGLHVFYRFNPHARAFEPSTERAVFVNLPADAMAPTAPLRIATALVEKTIDATLAAQAPQTPATPQAPAAQPARPVAADTPAAGGSKAADVSASLGATGGPAAS
jgi:spore germination cell wall hydrolase CwlJ-like protein